MVLFLTKKKCKTSQPFMFEWSLMSFQVALWTLAQLIESTGYVVDPYKKYPKLLEVLLEFLKTEQAPGIRREVFTVFCR